MRNMRHGYFSNYLKSFPMFFTEKPGLNENLK